MRTLLGSASEVVGIVATVCILAWFVTAPHHGFFAARAGRWSLLMDVGMLLAALGIVLSVVAILSGEERRAKLGLLTSVSSIVFAVAASVPNG